jgi:hypothetical protein
MKATIYWSGFVFLFLISCGSKPTQELVDRSQNSSSAIDEIIWREWGPPVAPKYNNTFKVMLSKKEGTISIDSVRTAGIEITRSLDPKDFDRVLQAKDEYKIQIGEDLSFDGCIGGSGHTISFFVKGEKVLEGQVVDCGGSQRSNIEGNFMAFIDEIRQLAFPKD